MANGNGNRSAWWLVGVLGSIIATGLVGWITFNGPNARADHRTIMDHESRIRTVERSNIEARSDIKHIREQVDRIATKLEDGGE